MGFLQAALLPAAWAKHGLFHVFDLTNSNRLATLANSYW
jgi:hypothetical protein